jgi:hypothetical protein
VTIESAPSLKWTDIDPKDATDLDLSKRLDITAPLNEEGERCPWPWEPQQLVGAPMGQYRCPYCMAMVMAGMPHLDYAPEERLLTRDNAVEVAAWCGGAWDGDAGQMSVDSLGETVYARPGDTLHRDGYGLLAVRTAAETEA